MAQRRKVDGAKMATLRTAKRIDQTELAVRLRKRGLGATQATVSRWENGQEPRAYALPAIAAELGVSIEELYADDDEEAASMPLTRSHGTPLSPDELTMLGDLMGRLMGASAAARREAVTAP